MIQLFDDIKLKQYRRGLETCSPANLAKSGREYFLLFFRRVRATSMTQRRVEKTRVHLLTFSPVSVNVFEVSYGLIDNFRIVTL